MAKKVQRIKNDIRELRAKKGLTQEQLSMVTNIARPHLSNIEKGYYYPNYDTLARIAKALDEPIESLNIRPVNL